MQAEEKPTQGFFSAPLFSGRIFTLKRLQAPHFIHYETLGNEVQ